MKLSKTLLAVCLATVGMASTALASPIDGSYTANTLAANDDGSTGLVSLGFDFNYYGTTYNSLYVNNNGNVTFTGSMSTYTPFGLTGSIGTPIIAPFFADVDTRGAGNHLVTYEAKASGVGGHATFGVEWPGVGYYGQHTDKLNTFELLIVNRADIGAGDADIYFNYGSMQWETGDASSGSGGLGGQCAHVGYSNGTGTAGTNYEVPGSGVCGALIDGGANQLVSATNNRVPGQFLFQVRNGQVVNPAPEPASLLLAGLGLAALGASRRRDRT